MFHRGYIYLAFKIKRTDLNRYRDKKELKQSGIYFLFGKIGENKEENVVYIGQASQRKNDSGFCGI